MSIIDLILAATTQRERRIYEMSKIPKKLYELEVITDDPRFEGFALTEAPSVLGRSSLDDDIRPGFEDAIRNPNWTQVRLKDLWIAPKVVGRVAIFNDYPGIDLLFPAFSQNAVNHLREFLEPNGELLPVRSDLKQQYFFYNITTVSDALDHSDSECTFFRNPPTVASSIDYFAFDAKKLEGLSIFRLRELPTSVIVSDEFVQRVETSGLNGFSFTNIWPLPRGVHWRSAASEKRGNDFENASLKKETFVIILPLKGLKPSASERKRITKIEDELDAQLVNEGLNRPYFGSYEGSDVANNEFRIFLTTPDVVRLEKKLKAWVESLPRPIQVIKRFGQLHDPHALEKTVEYK